MQTEIINSVLGGHDTLGLLPTGGGKSVTFQVPAMMLPGLTLVVTPLISLMKDQVDNLAQRGIRAVLFHSGLTPRERALAMERCRLGKAKIAYLSPERLQNEAFMAELRGLQVSLLVVDEAHCISQWGYDFRPSYLNIASLRRLIGVEVPVLALTASATPEVTADIMKHLGFREPRVYARSFRRDNLSYIVRLTDHKESLLLKVLGNTRGCSIVYVRSRKRTRDLADLLRRSGISALAYHAGLEAEEKDLRQDMWKSGQVRVMVATNAFGMGIDKPDVRLVVHYDLPSSLEEYYQEAGRGGRDGLPALAVVIATVRDKGLLTRRLNDAFPPKDFIGKVYELAGNFLGVAVGEGYGAVYEFNFAQFCDTYKLPPVPTQSALGLLTRSGYIEYIEETTSRSRLMMLMTRDELYHLTIPTPEAERVLQNVLRTYTGIFADYEYINEVTIAERLRLSSQQVYESLLLLSRMRVLHYVPRATTPYVVFTTSREEPRHLIIPTTVYEHQRRRMEQRLEAMKEFVYSSTQCRAETLLRYFGQDEAEECGTCDICRDRTRAARNNGADKSGPLDETIMYRAGQPGGVMLRKLVDDIGAMYGRSDVVAAVRQLADAGRVRLEGERVTAD